MIFSVLEQLFRCPNLDRSTFRVFQRPVWAFKHNLVVLRINVGFNFNFSLSGNPFNYIRISLMGLPVDNMDGLPYTSSVDFKRDQCQDPLANSRKTLSMGPGQQLGSDHCATSNDPCTAFRSIIPEMEMDFATCSYRIGSTLICKQWTTESLLYNYVWNKLLN